LRYCLKEYGKWIEITGYRNISFAKAEEFLKTNRKEIKQTVELQFFDAELTASQQHLYFAVLNALQAFQNKTNISKSQAMETMLYASAQRQIQRAIQQCGIRPETRNMAVLIIGEKPNLLKSVVETISEYVGVEPDDEVLEMSRAKEKKIIKSFQITDEEIKAVMKNDNHETAVVNLVIERVALLSTQI
jgi:tRNA threonylcarbamoyladenosine modification (KEOPS) complex Cgi121 subunit